MELKDNKTHCGKALCHLALFMPLIVPLLASAVLGLVVTSHIHFPNIVAYIGGALLMILAIPGIAFIPYIFFAAVVMWWGRKKTAKQLLEASWFLPLLFSMLCMICFGGLDVMTQSRLTGLSILMAFMAIPYGYAYVFIVQITAWFVKRRAHAC